MFGTRSLVTLAVAAIAWQTQPAVHAVTSRGIGTGALIGGDLTDPENDGDPEANVNYNAIFNSSEEPGFGGGEFAFNVFDNQVGGGNMKWCCGDQNNFPANPIFIDATFQTPVRLTTFTLTSGITFNAVASPFTFNGNGITLTGDVMNLSTGLQTINLPMELPASPTATRTFTMTTGGGNIALGGVLSGAGGLTVAGVGTLSLRNTANAFTNEIAIGGGTVNTAGAVVNVASLSDYGVPSSIGARLQSQEVAAGNGIGLHFRSGTLQYTGSTPQSTNREIRIQNGTTGGTIDASGSTPTATLSFTHTGANINLFDTGGARTLTLTGTNTGNNSFSIRLTNQATNQTTLRKAGTGTWFIPNSDNTYTGETIFAGGILNLASLSDYGVESSIGPRTLAEENTTVTGVSLHFQGGLLDAGKQWHSHSGLAVARP